MPLSLPFHFSMFVNLVSWEQVMYAYETLKDANKREHYHRLRDLKSEERAEEEERRG
jgi:DnaJ-class molecular chaperone